MKGIPHKEKSLTLNKQIVIIGLRVFDVSI